MKRRNNTLMFYTVPTLRIHVYDKFLMKLTKAVGALVGVGLIVRFTFLFYECKIPDVVSGEGGVSRNSRSKIVAGRSIPMDIFELGLSLFGSEERLDDVIRHMGTPVRISAYGGYEIELISSKEDNSLKRLVVEMTEDPFGLPRH